jgi:GNAT superfamily N-acetyltransferase/RimJ/RimL family protein N-acetyltransferase
MPACSAAVYRLESGEDLTVRVLEPPLGEYADLVEYWWRDIRGPLVAGEFADTSLDRFVVGELAGEYVGSMTYCAPRDTRDLALLEMVWTRPDQRRKGIGRTLLGHTLGDFRALGGVAMYLCTTNPHAFALYTAAGFRPHVGDGLRYLAPGQEDFDRTYFAPAGPATVRPATWGDIARVSALYNQPEPGWLIKDYPRRVFRGMRYESHYIRVWKPASEGRGVALVLENPLRRVVGIASLVEVDSFYEQHVQVLDFWACPAYLGQLPDLVAAIIEQADQGNAELLEARVAESDVAKRQVLRASGFSEEARLRDRLRLDDERLDLLVYSRSCARRTQPAHPLASYYGARPPFMRPRMSPPRRHSP